MNNDPHSPMQPETAPQPEGVRLAPEQAVPPPPAETMPAPSPMTDAQVATIPSTAPVAAPTPAPMPTPPSSTSPPSKKSTFQFKDPKVIIAAVLGAGILLFGFLYVRSTMQPAEAPTAQVTPTINPTPTPALNLSGIASTSAFLKYSEDVASFSAILNAFNLQDATLSPPILDTEIDLSE